MNAKPKPPPPYPPGHHPNQEAAHFQPGNQWSGNRAGRPAGRSIQKILNEELDKIAGDIPKRRKLAELIVRKALAGDRHFVGIALDRAEGRVAERVQISGHDGGPLDPETTRRAAMRKILGNPDLLAKAIDLSESIADDLDT